MKWEKLSEIQESKGKGPLPIPAFLGSSEVSFRCFMRIVTKLLQMAEVLPVDDIPMDTQR